MKPFSERILRISFLDTNKKVVDHRKMLVEERLKALGALTIDSIKTLDELAQKACDLVIIDATQIPESEFSQWIQGLAQRMAKQGAIWVPALIVAEVSFQVLKEFLPTAAGMNWYFDVLAPSHVDSLPIRVANLLRIHDHLHEMGRYQATLNQLTDRVDALSAEIKTYQSPTVRDS